MANPVQPVTCSDAQALTKSDTTTYTAPFDAVYVGGAGDVAVRTSKGTTITFSGATAGSTIPIQFDRLMSTNTTATLCNGLRY